MGEISLGGFPFVELWQSGLKTSFGLELFENEELLVISGQLIGVSEEHFDVPAEELELKALLVRSSIAIKFLDLLSGV